MTVTGKGQHEEEGCTALFLGCVTLSKGFLHAGSGMTGAGEDDHTLSNHSCFKGSAGFQRQQIKRHFHNASQRFCVFCGSLALMPDLQSAQRGRALKPCNVAPAVDGAWFTAMYCSLQVCGSWLAPEKACNM